MRPGSHLDDVTVFLLAESGDLAAASGDARIMITEPGPPRHRRSGRTRLTVAGSLRPTKGPVPEVTGRWVPLRPCPSKMGEAANRVTYFGKTVNRCARLRALAAGGQTLVSAATRELVREGLPETVTLHDLGERTLKDMSEPERVYEVVGADAVATTEVR